MLILQITLRMDKRGGWEHMVFISNDYSLMCVQLSCLGLINMFCLCPNLIHNKHNSEPYLHSYTWGPTCAATQMFISLLWSFHMNNWTMVPSSKYLQLLQGYLTAYNSQSLTPWFLTVGNREQEKLEHKNAVYLYLSIRTEEIQPPPLR